jgi:glycosyltransferase involved in cell wall biosynthesis
VLSASSRSVYRLVSIIQYFPFIARKCVYFVIGGFFPSAVESGKYKIKPYNKLRSIIVEGKGHKLNLLTSGCSIPVNCIPNFKAFPAQEPFLDKCDSLFRFVFVSRICPEKGVREIIEASKLLFQDGYTNFSVTFYGPIESGFVDEFNASLNPILRYEGQLDILGSPELSYSVLRSYDTMIFPTSWIGEGFPGVIIDAFVAGLPVIASDWNMNTEIIRHNDNGIIIPSKDQLALSEAMRLLLSDRGLCRRLAYSSFSCAFHYHIDKVCPQIIEAVKK